MEKVHIIDYTIFNGDPIIELRIPYLYDYVDEFIIIESFETFTGIKKDKYHFYDYIDFLQPYMDKITFLKIDSFPLNNLNPIYHSLENNKNVWANEDYQRNFGIDYVLDKYKGKKYYLLVCDIDEIPKISLINKLNELYNKNNNVYYHLEMHIFKYSFRWMKKERWYHPFILPDKLINTDSLSRFRMKNNYHIINAGWHCCYFNTINNLIKKIESFSHTEFNKPEIKNRNFIKNCMLTGRFFLNSSGDDILYINNIDDLPNGWQEFQTKMDNIIWNEEKNL